MMLIHCSIHIIHKVVLEQLIEFTHVRLEVVDVQWHTGDCLCYKFALENW